MADNRRLPRPDADVWDWQRLAACRSMDNSRFFPLDGERGHARARREADAKRVCHDCPVLRQCRNYALTVHEPYGVWGGMTQSERRTILHGRRARKV